jgi:hypothetical protein
VGSVWYDNSHVRCISIELKARKVREYDVSILLDENSTVAYTLLKPLTPV